MYVSLVITILGTDRSGLVSSISEVIENHKGSWTESRMAHLAGKFAGILHISLPKNNLENLSIALDKLQTNDLRIQIETAQAATNPTATKTLDIEILCQDRIGIINDVTETLAKLNVNIEELDSTVKEASMSGGMLFSAELSLSLPENITADEVEDALEEMSDHLMIDIKLS